MNDCASLFFAFSPLRRYSAVAVAIAASCCAPCAANAATTYVTAANFGSHRTLLNGNVYRFAGSVSYTADRGENAMTVADGANVVIAIPAGVSVRLTGGDALLRNGAGAGIEVPGNATLTICGEGELIATGGAAYEGASGESGNGAGYIDGGVHLMYAGGVGTLQDTTAISPTGAVLYNEE